MSKLLSPFTIKGINFRNRVAISPMCQYSSTHGFANSWHSVHYGSRAVGGAGLIIQEATAVSAEGRITPSDLGIYKIEHLEKLKNITKFITEHGAVPGIQLAHAGRKAGCAEPWNGGKQLRIEDGGWKTVSSSAKGFYDDDLTPDALDAEGIQKVISDFRMAAERSVEAGYQVVEIHAAHGYLIHQFLSPLVNNRSDEYGGSFENRIRLLLEVVRGVKTVWPDKFPLFVRISATDWVEGGWDIIEAVQLSKRLKEEGVDLIDCSSGGTVPYARINPVPGFQVPFADRIKNETGILTGTVGLITEAHQAEEILSKGQADLILIARESLRDPHFPLNAANTLADDVDWPKQYLRAKF